MGDSVLEMDAAEKQAVDAAIAAAAAARTAELLKERMLSSPLDEVTHSVSVSGLVITVNIENLVDDDETTITADPSDTKYAKVCYVYDESADEFSVQVFERTTGLYDDLEPPEYLVEQMSEYYVVANGTELVEVT